MLSSDDVIREMLSLRILQSWNMVREHVERRRLINPNMGSGSRDVGNLYMWMELYDTDLGPPRYATCKNCIFFRKNNLQDSQINYKKDMLKKNYCGV